MDNNPPQSQMVAGPSFVCYNTAMNPLEAYLRELDRIRASGAGTPELSYYSALATLFSTAGEDLDPEVRCIMPLADQGAGFEWPPRIE